jgi:hypothetical protein
MDFERSLTHEIAINPVKEAQENGHLAIALARSSNRFSQR